jgi:hypothetical protein
MQLVSHDSKPKLPFAVPFERSTSRRFTSTNFLGLTPDTMLKNNVCPDVLLMFSQHKSCRGLRRLSVTTIIEERDFLPGINARVSIPSIR